MQTELEKKWCKIYSEKEHNVDYVNDNIAQLLKSAELTQQEVESSATIKESFSEVRRNIDMLEKNEDLFTKRPKKQVRVCLVKMAILPQFRKKKRLRVIRMLVLELFSEWNAKLREHFCRCCRMLEEYTETFLSYTNDGASVLNARFVNVIQGSHLKKTNELARYLHNTLSNRSARFFDKRSIPVGGEIEAIVKKSAQSTFVFVQLISQDIFQKRPDQNWCFNEFDWFTSNKIVSSQVLFLVASPNIKKNNDPKFNQWFEDYKKRKHLMLSTNIEFLGDQIEKLNKQIDKMIRQTLRSI